MDSAAFYRLQAGLGLVTGGLYLLAAPGPTTPLLWGTAALAGLAAASLPRLWLRLQEHRASLSLEAGFRDLLGHLAVQTAAGIPLLHALAAAPAVVREPLRREVEALVADLRLSPLPAAMERFAARTGHPEIATFAQHVAHAQRVGIALPDLLREEEKHALAIYRQAVRRRIKAGALTMALVTVILLVNGLLIYGTPLAFTILEFISGE
jgi:Flp pilus assembly protein TadB